MKLHWFVQKALAKSSPFCLFVSMIHFFLEVLFVESWNIFRIIWDVTISSWNWNGIKANSSTITKGFLNYYLMTFIICLVFNILGRPSEQISYCRSRFFLLFNYVVTYLLCNLISTSNLTFKKRFLRSAIQIFDVGLHYFNFSELMSN